MNANTYKIVIIGESKRVIYKRHGWQDINNTKIYIKSIQSRTKSNSKRFIFKQVNIN
jgi:hypothetical protein